jgi:hypothetical protein
MAGTIYLKNKTLLGNRNHLQKIFGKSASGVRLTDLNFLSKVKKLGRETGSNS